MNIPLMPQATAVWLVENTSLSFQQVGDFCGLQPWQQPSNRGSYYESVNI